MHPRQHGVLWLPAAFDQRQMHTAAGFVLKGMCCKFAIRRVQHTCARFCDERFSAAAVLNQIRNRADFEAMLRSKQLQIWQTRHRAIVFHDLANDSAG